MLSQAQNEYLLTELRKGNREVLKGLPPSIIMSLGLALEEEAGKEVNRFSDKVDYDKVNEAYVRNNQNYYGE
ncbi:hypothetical protein IIO_06131 [Bacillus cereus VD115]|nr:hypothetical protein IIO_06131 [Bacillus cereus VD115]